jgi:uncharacterized 2Fe-2S/4Fe-4S cluster protein (DUF4445 family)
LSGLQGSALEQRVLTDAFGEEAISADKAIASAAEAVQNILTITAANLNAQLAVLSASSAVVNDIRDRVARGQVITIHASPGGSSFSTAAWCRVQKWSL